jgi:HlyD family secretion protein
LVRLERRDAEIAVAQSAAGLAQAQRQLSNLQQGRRPEEIASIAAALDSAEAQANEAERVLQRQSDLLERGISTQAAYDTASTGLELADAKVASSKPILRSRGCRRGPTKSRRRRPRSNRPLAILESAEWRLGQADIVHPACPGWSPTSSAMPGKLPGHRHRSCRCCPMVRSSSGSMCPNGHFPALRVGARLKVRCDGCDDGLLATVSYVSPDPEFTPPVIYSLENRQKLVYLVEARPDDDAWALDARPDRRCRS